MKSVLQFIGGKLYYLISSTLVVRKHIKHVKWDKNFKPQLKHLIAFVSLRR
jgi:hypothetical protein